MFQLSVAIVGDKEIIARFKSMPAAVQSSLFQKVSFLTLKLEAYIKKNKLSGQVLNRKSGRLLRAINSRVSQSALAVWGFVFVSADVPYAGIHEFGGRTNAHLIVPKKASVLAFTSAGKQLFAARVNHPGSTMPERSYMRSSLRDMSTEISLGMKEAIIKGVQEHMENK